MGSRRKLQRYRRFADPRAIDQDERPGRNRADEHVGPPGCQHQIHLLESPATLDGHLTLMILVALGLDNQPPNPGRNRQLQERRLPTS